MNLSKVGVLLMRQSRVDREIAVDWLGENGFPCIALTLQKRMSYFFWGRVILLGNRVRFKGLQSREDIKDAVNEWNDYLDTKGAE